MIHGKTVEQHHGSAGAAVGQRYFKAGKGEGRHGSRVREVMCLAVAVGWAE
jgi:hypothetical protein